MLNDPFTLLILSLATWRLSHMMAKEDGPFDCFRRLRILAGASENIGGWWQADNTLGKLIICPLCLSVWWAAGLYALLLAWPTILPILIILTISAISSIIEVWLQH